MSKQQLGAVSATTSSNDSAICKASDTLSLFFFTASMTFFCDSLESVDRRLLLAGVAGADASLENEARWKRLESRAQLYAFYE